MSYRVIKNHQVGLEKDNFKIPVVPTEGLQTHKDNKSPEIAQGEKNIYREAKSQANDILQQAKAQANQILEQASQKAQSLKQEAYDTAYQKGMREGQQKGYQEGIQETKQIREEAKGILQQVHQESRKYIEKTREEIVELATTIAKNIIHYSINLRDENIIEIVNVALKRAEERRQIVLRCHPAIALLLQTNLYQFRKICPNATFTFLEDKGIKEQGCIIETEAQVINLEVDQQLENIKAALLEMRKANEL